MIDQSTIQQFSSQEIDDIIFTIGDIDIHADDLFDQTSVVGFENALEVVAKQKVFQNLLEAKDFYGFSFVHLPAFANTIYHHRKEEYRNKALNSFRKEYS